MSFFKSIRVFILLTVLFVVAANQWKTRSRMSSWEKPVWITIYPVLTGSADEVGTYIDNLSSASFAEIGEFISEQAIHYGRDLNTPIMLQMAAPDSEQPPAIPAEGDLVSTVIWSLKMRWWVWRKDREDNLPSADIQMFVLYHDVDQPDFTERSVGVQNGMYGIVNAFASRSNGPLNRMVITHELLHILGATDKYYLSTSQPIYPIGLAQPGRVPLYPQILAEIMGGRIAVSETAAIMPRSLDSCVIGPATALEIGWN
ncbi:MAG: hypothetical protein ACI9H8_001057 [Lysobacterales bacterium]